MRKATHGVLTAVLDAAKEHKLLSVGTVLCAAASVLELVMDSADGICIMSYRDTAKAMLDTARGEIDLAASRKCRVVLGAETGQTGEGDFVSYFEEGRKAMKAELEIVRKDLSTRNLPAGYGVAVHHIGSWQKLKD